jgi:hypothetical protein
MDWSIILSSCIVAGTTIVSIVIKELLQKRAAKKEHCIVTYTKQNNNIQKAIDYLLSELNASRVHVYEFHNGDHFYSGGSQQKFSCTYESLAAGVSAESLNLQNLRISTFNNFIEQTIQDGGFSLETLDKCDTLLCKNWFDARGVHSSYAVAIRTLNKSIIGILSIDFNHKQKITKEQQKLLFTQSIIISGYLI